MRSMKGEVVLNMAAEKAWKMYRDNEIVSKINPEMLAQAFYIQGDGSPGSLRVFKLGPAISSYVKESTEKIEQVEIGKSVTYQVIGGELAEMYSPYIVTFTFRPLEVGDEDEDEDEDENKGKTMCTAEWKAEFEPLLPTTPPPDKAKDAALGFLKCFDNFHLD